MKILFAEIILIIHFIIFLFICLGFILIPIGYSLDWNWIKNRIIRLIHISLMGFVTIETIIGVICPLTSIEFLLRDGSKVDSNLTLIIHKIMYWNLPNHYFIVLYIICLTYLVVLWILFKPKY